MDLKPLQSLVLSCALALSCASSLALAAGGANAAEVRAPAPGLKLDHILLWGRSLDQVTAVMSAKLGFRVAPGRDPGGLANRYVRLADQSFIELLGVTRPNPELDPGAQSDQVSLKGGPGARSFGIHTALLDQMQGFVRGQGFAPTAIFTAGANDPDGQGPGKPPRWRLFAFERAPLSSSLFFIDYAPRRTDPASVADDRAQREHANGVQALSEILLLSSDAEADRKQLEKMGFPGARPVRIPQLHARGYCVPVGPDSLVTLEPDGPGIAADALTSGGPQMMGVGLGVADLDQAQHRVERGYETAVVRYAGLLGPSFLAPTQADLGLLIEFHALRPGASPAPCGQRRVP